MPFDPSPRETLQEWLGPLYDGYAGYFDTHEKIASYTADEREALQKRVELLHRDWTKDREYLPPPTAGKLADLDPAVLVTPPKGLEIGYVPIVTRQSAQE